MKWLYLWYNQTEGLRVSEETREKYSWTHRSSHSFFLLQAPLKDRQISFGASSRCIWRLLCLSFSMPASLPLSYSPSLPFSLSWLFWLVNYFIQHICWIDAWIIHQLHVVTIISFYFYLPGLCWNNLRCYWLDFCSFGSAGGGEQIYKIT